MFKDLHILIAEDEVSVADFIKAGLEVKGYKVEAVHDGEAALKRAKAGFFDVIILDVNLPLINGFEVCSHLRASYVNTPVLMLTALGTIRNKISGFEAGADDYLVKPFEFEELIIRIKALVKRTRDASLSQNVLQVEDLVMDVNLKSVKRAGKEIELTQKEFLLLEYMLRNKGRVLSRSEIAEKIWDINFDSGTNVIDLYVFYLRKKIDKNFQVKLIHTQVGMGYVLKEK